MSEEECKFKIHRYYQFFKVIVWSAYAFGEKLYSAHDFYLPVSRNSTRYLVRTTCRSSFKIRSVVVCKKIIVLEERKSTTRYLVGYYPRLLIVSP
jgi:hypothetical protein